MSVRVVARIRPLLKQESERDVIVEATGNSSEGPTIVKIPNPKNEAEAFSFHFNSVYSKDSEQSEIFEKEVSPTVKHLFNGFDVTLFAYGVTGTGKTHTMRGGKSLQDRGMIPRLLSSIYRRGRKIEKDSAGERQVQVVMSYYEIYNDKVYDLFESPEQRTLAGLPIRDNNGKTMVVGLTERPCTTLKEFETLYDQANMNRSTSATKLNASSSRSHAILCVRIVQTTGNEVRTSTASAIDLAGSEDNRRTENNKDRLVESASINKSLFVLAQCVEAISKKQARIPYRESKMTRILSLGQNNGLTVMILNLAPVRNYHLDSLSSLNFANRTKKIEVNEVENIPVFEDQPVKSKLDGQKSTSLVGPSIHRQPLRPKVFSQEGRLKTSTTSATKPTKQFSVYADPAKSLKRTSNQLDNEFSRPAKFSRPTGAHKSAMTNPDLSKEGLEALIERKVTEAFAERADHSTLSSGDPISDEVQRRLHALEKRVEGQENERTEGLHYLLMAKQHQVRGEDRSALRMYQLALSHFPGNEKLTRKVAALHDKINTKNADTCRVEATHKTFFGQANVAKCPTSRQKPSYDDDDSYHEAQDIEGNQCEEDDDFSYRPRTKIRRPQASKPSRTAPFAVTSGVASTAQHCARSPSTDSEDGLTTDTFAQTPRTRHLLQIINTKDVNQIRLLRGVGAKKAEAIVNCLCNAQDDARVNDLGQLESLRGVGVRTVETMRRGLVV